MDTNVGAGFENPLADLDAQALCPVFLASFAVAPELTEQWLDVDGVDLTLYTVYRPAHWVAGEKYPIVTWGNGTCMPPETYGALLRYIASQGFVVVAPNGRMVGSGEAQAQALEFALAANEDASSPYYQRLDPSKVAVLGHSQGALSASTAAADPRVGASILFSAASQTAAKPFLTVSAERDVGVQSASELAAIVDAAPEAAYLFFHKIATTGTNDGYLLPVFEARRVADPSAAWLEYLLNGDAQSRRQFVGGNCGLCGHNSDYEYGQHGLD